jgi:deazaflavin-dependent oxidoreductase (nitroreductase family)
MQGTATPIGFRPPRAPVARVFGPAAHLLNPVLIRLAGTRWIPLWGIVRHRGRRSSRPYSTPVAIGHRDDALFIPLPFGDTADWVRNVLAARGCVVRWNGAEHEMIDPEVIHAASGLAAFNVVEARLLEAVGIKGILRLRFVAH